VSGGYMLTGAAPASAQSGAGAMGDAAPVPQVPAEDEALDTMGTPAPDPEEDTSAAPSEPGAVPVRAERDILESLTQRREALERRDRELTLRENLLRAAKTRVEQRIEELR